MKKIKKSNKTLELPEEPVSSELAECFSEIAESEEELQYMKVIALCRLGMSLRKAAQTVGFSNSFASDGIYKMMKTPNSKLRKAAEKIEQNTKFIAQRYRKTFAPLLAPTLAEIDLKMAETMLADPELAIKNPAALRQLKSQSGIISDEQPQVPTISIDRVQTLMLGITDSQPARQLSQDVVDAEVLDQQAGPQPEPME